MAGPVMGGMNPMLALLSPEQQQSYMQLQQQQALGQAMLQQGMQPVDMGQNAVGGMAYHVSPLNGINKVLQTYLGNRMAMQSMGQQAQLMGQMYGNAFGGGQPQQQPQAAPTDAGGMTGDQSGAGVVSSPVAAPGGAPSGAQIGAAMGGGAPAQAAPQTQMPNGALTLPGKTPQQSMLLFSMLGPDAYGRMLEQQMAPTDATRMARAAGLPEAPANAAALLKANNLPFNTYGPNTILQDPRTGQMSVTPSAAPEGSQTVLTPNGPQVVQTPGALAAIGGAAAARTAGEGSQLPFTEGKDASGNPLPVMSRTQATTGQVPGSAAIPQIESQGNPNAVSPKGAVGAWQVMPNTNANPGFGVKPAQNNSPAELNRVGQDYFSAMSQRYGDPALAAVAYNMGPGATDKWLAGGGNFSKLPQETQLYLGRWTAANAVNNHAAPQGSGSGSGAVYAAAPLGATSNANAAQQASADSMKASYAKLQGINSSANGALDALQKMQALAANKNSALTVGALGTAVAPLMSPDAAEYEKQRANVISLIANQNGTNGSDAGRALTGESVPDYGKPKAAIQDGLQTQINQIRAQQLKANLLTPVYQSGDSKAYTTLENQFDQSIKPSMMPILNLSGDAQRAAVQSAIKANPALRPNFEWAFNNGLLK